MAFHASNVTNSLLRLLILLFTSIAFTVAVSAQQSQPGSDLDPEFVEKVREVLLTNPEILEEAFNALQEKRMTEANAARGAAIADNRELIFDSENQVVLGNPDGDVTLVEFFDYNCGFCRRAVADMLQLLETDPNLRIVIKEFPILGPGSLEAARVAYAVNRVAPERYLDFHLAIMDAPGQADHTVALTAVKDIGLPVDEIEALSAPEEADLALQEVQAIGQVLQISGTPAYVIGNEVIEGAVGLASLREKIEAMRLCGETECS